MRRIVSLLGLLFAIAPAVAGPFDGMLKVLPATTNTLVLVDVSAIYDSPLAKSLKWSEAYAQRFRAGVNTLPPDARRVAIACATNMSNLRREWQLVLTEVRQVANAREVAARESGILDEVAGRFAVLSPRDVYFTSISEQESAAWYPANRQLLSHWIRNVPGWQKRAEPALSKQLKAVVARRGEKEHLLVAFDLTDAFDRESIRAALDDSPSVLASQLNKEGLANTLVSLRGISLGVSVTDKLTGTIRVDFGLDPTPYRRVLKELFIEALEDEGAAIGDLHAWSAEYQENSLTLSGPLEPGTMARLMALFEFPNESDAPPAPLKPDETKPNPDLTRNYFNAVLECIDEVRQSKMRKDYLKTAAWHETYAAKIERLSTRFVDPEAVKFGLSIAEYLRAIAASLRGATADAKAIATGAFVFTYQPTRRWFGPGWASVATNVPKKRSEIAKIVADESKTRTQLWSQIETAIAGARVALTAKYGKGFH
jgi:cytochrome c551/c552